MDSYDVGLVCLNGHEINASSQTSPNYNSKFCKDCGKPTISACPKCEANIRGLYDNGWDGGEWSVPQYCHECGAPYPWTERKMEALAEAIDELGELSDTERDKLKESIPDVIQETIGTTTATICFKKAIVKAGTVGGKVLTDVIGKVAAEVVVRALGIR